MIKNQDEEFPEEIFGKDDGRFPSQGNSPELTEFRYKYINILK